MCSDSPATPGGGVSLGDVPGDRVDAGAGVSLQEADGGVAGAGQQHRGGGAALGIVGQGTVTEPVNGPTVQVLMSSGEASELASSRAFSSKISSARR